MAVNDWIGERLQPVLDCLCDAVQVNTRQGIVCQCSIGVGPGTADDLADSLVLMPGEIFPVAREGSFPDRAGNVGGRNRKGCCQPLGIELEARLSRCHATVQAGLGAPRLPAGDEITAEALDLFADAHALIQAISCCVPNCIGGGDVFFERLEFGEPSGGHSTLSAFFSVRLGCCPCTDDDTDPQPVL